MELAEKAMAGGDVVQFLLNKFFKSFAEAESELSSPSGSFAIPILSNLREIKDHVVKLVPVPGKQMMVAEPRTVMSLLYELNDALAECRMLGQHDVQMYKKKNYFNPLKNYFIVREMKKRLKTMKGEFARLAQTAQEVHASNSNTNTSTSSSIVIVDRLNILPIVSDFFYGYTYYNKAAFYPVDPDLGPPGSPFKAIALVGIAGVGKTTHALHMVLAKYRLFSPIIWIGLSNKNSSSSSSGSGELGLLAHGDCCSIVTCIIRKAQEFAPADAHVADDSNSSSSEQRLDTLLERMHQILSGKRYLIVLDDVWHTNDHFYSNLGDRDHHESSHGHRLSDGLPKDSGGRVLVTTRRLEVAQQMLGADNNELIFPIRPLADRECWGIFMESEANSENKSRRPDLAILTKYKKEILEQSKGLPLAAKTLAQLIPFLGDQHVH